MIITIAIDGPVGAGKSSIAHQVAQRLQIPHLDTGAMYRAAGYAALKANVSLDDEDQVNHFISTTDIEVILSAQNQQVLINGEDVTAYIRTPQVSMAASDISKWPSVRKKLVALQQQIARRQSILLDGRDIGTRVLPDASVKIFLTATPQERARRRYEELKAKGDTISFQQVLEELEARDFQDTTRKTDPLKKAEDAHEVDSTNLTIEQVVDKILGIVEAKHGRTRA